MGIVVDDKNGNRFIDDRVYCDLCGQDVEIWRGEFNHHWRGKCGCGTIRAGSFGQIVRHFDRWGQKRGT